MKKSKDIKAFNILSYTLIALVALICLIPFLIVIIGSFTDEKEIIARVSLYSQMHCYKCI